MRLTLCLCCTLSGMMGLSPNGNGGTGAPILARVVINATAIDAKALMAAAIDTGRCRVHVGRPTRHYEFLHAKKLARLEAIARQR